MEKKRVGKRIFLLDSYCIRLMSELRIVLYLLTHSRCIKVYQTSALDSP